MVRDRLFLHSSTKVSFVYLVASPKLKKATKRSTGEIPFQYCSLNIFFTCRFEQKSCSSSIDHHTNEKEIWFLISHQYVVYLPKIIDRFSAFVESLITPSRTPAPVTSSTPNLSDLVLIRHTSTPKPGETASRITIGGNESALPLSAIQEVSPAAARISSPTLSTITTTDISTALTPVVPSERRSTVRGQAAMARKKIAAMQIRDDESDGDENNNDQDEDEEFKELFSQKRTKKSKEKILPPSKKSNDLSDLSVCHPC